VSEHEFEPVAGLPERLPEGERMLWQGTPDFRALARHAFHIRKVAVYFAILLVWRGASEIADGQSWAVAATAVLGLLPIVTLGLGLIALLAWLTARATIFTITDQRVVLRFGVALPMAMNVPFKVIDSAELRLHPDGTGDLPLALAEGQRIGWLVNWPYVRGGRRSQPMLRAVRDARGVAALLGEALARHSGGNSTVEPAIRDSGAAPSRSTTPRVAAPA
jgi:hypothetical protein